MLRRTTWPDGWTGAAAKMPVLAVGGRMEVLLGTCYGRWDRYHLVRRSAKVDRDNP